MSMKSKTKEQITLETEIVAGWHNSEDYYDDDFAYGSCRSSVDTTTIGKFIQNYPEDASEWENLDNDHPENLLQFVYQTADNYEFNVMLKSEYDERKEKEDMDYMNNLAASFAKEWNVTAGTMEFIERMYKEMDKLDYEYERYNNYECRAERWMDSRYSGQSYEGFYSDEDYGHSQFGKRADDLEKIRKWLCLNCPMTMAAFSEQMLVRKANGEIDEEE
jgi:hypothetical protein